MYPRPGVRRFADEFAAGSEVQSEGIFVRPEDMSHPDLDLPDDAEWTTLQYITPLEDYTPVTA